MHAACSKEIASGSFTSRSAGWIFTSA